MDLHSQTVADFYHTLFEKLAALDIEVKIYPRPNEMEPAIPFKENVGQTTYKTGAAYSVWQAMLRTNEVFQHFRSSFIGKVSPVHLFWGAFDLAVTRFSGNPAPTHPGGMPNMPLDVMQEAYSHEVSSAGFWPGSPDFPVPLFYSYLYPVADNFQTQKILPEKAFYSEEMGEFILKYDDVRNAENPGKILHDFLQSTYEAAANTAKWEREKLEVQP